MRREVTNEPRYPLQRSKARKAVLAGITEGLSNRQIAARLETQGIHVSFQSIARWRESNLERVESAVQKIEERIEDYAVSRKAHRIRKLDEIGQKLSGAIAERGVVYTETTRNGEKLHAHPAVSELRAVYAQVAQELDQLPRAGVNIAVQNTVIVKQVQGGENEELRRLAGG